MVYPQDIRKPALSQTNNQIHFDFTVDCANQINVYFTVLGGL
jgi:hypothetical protein